MKTPAWAAPTSRILLPALVLLTAGCTNSLNRAIYREKPEKVDEFLNAGANVNQPDDNGGTPLIYAAQFGDLALIKKLVAHGAKVDPIDRKGNSALSYLVSGESYKNDAVVFLLSQKPRVDVVNNEGHAPLHLAAMRACKPADADRQVELLKLLVDAGADPNAKPTGDLPLHFAAFAGQPQPALAYLLHVTKEPQALSHEGYTAFTEAAWGDQHDAAVFFAGQGFTPQKLAPVPTTEAASAMEPTLPINARAHDAFGDYESAHGEPAGALASYQQSATNYRAAIDGYRRMIDYNTTLLKSQKDARRGKWMSTVALNIVGVGLGAATGVGFFVVPKRTKASDEDRDYGDELERQQTELTVLTKEQDALKVKIQEIQKRLPAAAPAPGVAAPRSS